MPKKSKKESSLNKKHFLFITFSLTILFAILVIALTAYIKICNTDQCIYEKAVSKANVNLCMKISNKTLFEKCTTTIAVKRNDPSICKFLKHAQDWCKAEVAIANENLILCTRVQTEKWRNLCFKKFAIKTLNIDVCNLITNDKEATLCYRIIAEVSKDPGLCDFILNEDARNSCFSLLAHDLINESLCQKINEFLVREQCLFDVAKAKRDPNICNTIKIGVLKNNCLLYVSSKLQST